MFKTLSYFESLKLIFRWILYYDKKLAILFFFQTTHEKWLNDYENLDNNNDNNNDDDNDDKFSEFTHDFINLDTLHLTFSIIRDK